MRGPRARRRRRPRERSATRCTREIENEPRARQRVLLFRADDRPRSSDHGSSSEGHARPCLVDMWRALARHARRDVRAAMRSSARAGSSSGRAGSAERPLPAAAASSAESIAGANTSEYLVKVPASLEAGMDAAQSTTRSRLLTLTSVAAAAYLGYFIFPLVGGGTASSAVHMCASKDVIFRKAGVARLRAVLRVSRDGAHVKHDIMLGDDVEMSSDGPELSLFVSPWFKRMRESQGKKLDT